MAKALSALAAMHAGDLRGQIGLALDNLAAVLEGAGMGFANTLRLRIFTTDPHEAIRKFDLLGARIAAAGVAPPVTLPGVASRAHADLMFEIEATAAD